MTDDQQQRVTREPVPIDSPSPASSSAIETTPTSEYINKLTVAIRGGLDPYTASEWAGTPRAVFERWMEEHEHLRTAVDDALKHADARLSLEVAKRSPDKALRRLRAGARRLYSSGSGHTVVSKATPFLLARIVDETIPAIDLTPLEVVAREMRKDIIADAGGDNGITTVKRHLIDSYIGIWIAASSLDLYIAEMGATGGLVSRKHRRAFPIIEQRARLADSLLRLAQAIGLERAKPGASDLQSYITQKYGTEQPHERDDAQQGASQP